MELAHTRRGSGPALVVLQHFVGRELWEPVVDLLAREREVWSVDLPGFGDSVLPPGQVLEIGAMAAAMADWFDSVGLESPHVVGNSYAGAVAIELARTGGVASATAISPVGLWTSAEAALVMASVSSLVASARLGGWLAPWMSRTALGRRLPGLQLVAHPLRLPADVGVAWVRAVARTRLDPRLALPILGYRVERFELEVPLTIAWGDRDRVTPPAQARRAARLIPGARHVTLTSCGHVPMFDDPQQVAQAILG